MKDLYASMGPPELPGGNPTRIVFLPPAQEMLQWGRRNYPAETFHRSLRRPGNECRFNGAAGITRRKLRGVDGSAAPNTSLQWGRRNYPAETAVRPGESSPQPGASMGPPELPGGNSRPRKIRHARNERLQWGRRNYPAETPPVATLNAAKAAGASMGPPELPGGNR